jgi:hypothetical protein
MDYLFLPYLKLDDPLVEALRRMRRTDSRAIVLEQGSDDRRLYMNKAVVEAWSDGKSACSELPVSEGTMLPDVGATPHVPWPPPLHALGSWHSVEKFLEKQLDAQQATYGILLPRPGDARSMALVVSRHEPDADKIRNAVKYCRCTKNKTHTSQGPPALDNNSCFVCSGTYKCY